MVNEEIFDEGFAESAEVRVIGADGEQLGILTAISALNSAYEKGLDLVLIAPQSVPPVARIISDSFITVLVISSDGISIQSIIPSGAPASTAASRTSFAAAIVEFLALG